MERGHRWVPRRISLISVAQRLERLQQIDGNLANPSRRALSLLDASRTRSATTSCLSLVAEQPNAGIRFSSWCAMLLFAGKHQEVGLTTECRKGAPNQNGSVGAVGHEQGRDGDDHNFSVKRHRPVSCVECIAGDALIVCCRAATAYLPKTGNSWPTRQVGAH